MDEVRIDSISNFIELGHENYSKSDIVFNFKVSRVDNKCIIFLNNVWLDTKLRKKGLIRKFLSFIIENYKPELLQLEVTSYSRKYWKNLGFQRNWKTGYYECLPQNLNLIIN